MRKCRECIHDIWEPASQFSKGKHFCELMSDIESIYNHSKNKGYQKMKRCEANNLFKRKEDLC